MAQPHPSQLFKPTTRPCWHCGTRHQSDTIPALCSDPCREAWQKLYQLQYGEPSAITPPKHTNHGCNVGPALNEHDDTVLRQLGTTVATATAGLDALKAAVRAEQERMNAEPHPADEPQDLVDTALARGRALDAIEQDQRLAACPPRPPEPPPIRLPLVDQHGMAHRQPWWRRWLRRG